MALSIKLNQLAWVIIKATYDETFRENLRQHPDKAIADEGYELSQQEIQIIRDLSPGDWGSLTLNDLNDRLVQAGVVDISSTTCMVDPGGPAS